MDYSINCNAVIHSNDGEFRQISKKYVSGGHGQTSIDYMNQNNIKYEVNIVYNNGVRAGNIIDSKNKQFKTGNRHTWFPEHWTIADIREAGTYVDSYLKKNSIKIIDGQHYTTKYNNVFISVIYNKGTLSTIFPSKNQTGGNDND